MQISLKFVPKEYIYKESNIGWANGLMPNKLLTIFSTNNGVIYWFIYASCTGSMS